MPEPNDEQLDAMLADFVSGALDPQCGRAEPGFRRYLSTQAGRRWKQGAWLLGTFLSGMAASVAALYAAPLFRAAQPPPVNLVSSDPARGSAAVQPANLIAPSFERLARSQTVDEGVIVLDGNTPVRVVRRKLIERTRWFNKDQAVTAQQIVPRDETLLIKLATY